MVICNFSCATLCSCPPFVILLACSFQLPFMFLQAVKLLVCVVAWLG